MFRVVFETFMKDYVIGEVFVIIRWELFHLRVARESMKGIFATTCNSKMRYYPIKKKETMKRRCHMKFDSRHIQGSQTNLPCYRFFRWHLIDIFVYFSHEFITIPPLVWIDCAHKNGVQILGPHVLLIIIILKY